MTDSTGSLSLGPNAHITGDVFTGGQHIYNYFTAGMEALPTRYDARVRNFLEYYVGTPAQPAPFGGRSADLHALDAWLADPAAPPYALLAAPAGRGKSGLLAHWVTRLAAAQITAAGASAPRWHVVFFPISIRFNTNLESVVFAGLAARLAHIFGEPIGPINDVQQYRGLFSEFLRRAPPGGGQLLIVLDGLDEAAGWEAAADLFPFAPPPHLRVLAAARLLAGDPDASRWLSQLSWDPPGRARRLKLAALDQAGVADVLVQIGNPLGALAAKSDLVAKLAALSEGDPLLVRLYVEALLPRAGQAAVMTPQDLETLQPGLEAYFDRWFDEQRKLWGTANPLQDKRVRGLLNLCAAALGPLSKDDVLALAPDVFEDSWVLDEAARSVNRFVIGDGEASGYVFSHPRLDDYFWARLAPREQQAWLERFLRLGRELVEALAAGTLAAAEASPYLVQYYGAHLEPADDHGQPPRAEAAALVAESWLRAHEAVSGTPIGFLADVRRAWRRAAADGPRALGQQVRAALCFTSVMALSASLPPELLADCVAARVMPLALGLVLARQKQKARERALALAALIPVAPAVERPALVAEAFDLALPILDEAPEALLALVDYLPPGLAARAAESVARADQIDNREVELARLANRLPEAEAAPLRQQALAIARHLGRGPQALPAALLALLPYLPEAERQDTAAQIFDYLPAIDEADERARVLHGLSAYVPAGDRPALLAEALAAAQSVEWDEVRAETLIGVVAALPPDLQDQARASLAEDFERAAAVPHMAIKGSDEAIRAHQVMVWGDMVEKYAFCLPTDKVEQLLAAAWKVDRPAVRAQALAALAQRLAPAEGRALLEQVVAGIDAESGEQDREDMLERVADKLPPDLAPAALAAARSLSDPSDRARLLQRLAARLPAEARAGALADALAAARALQDEPERARALAALARQLPQPQRAETLAAAWRVAQAIPAEDNRLAEVTRLAAHPLPEAVLDEMLALLAASANDVYRADALAALAPQLAGARLEAALAATRKMWRQGQSEPLLALAARLPPTEAAEVYAEAATAAAAIEHPGTRAQALMRVAHNVPAEMQQAAVSEAVAAIRAVRHAYQRTPWLAEMAGLADGDAARQQLLGEAFAALAEIPDQRMRAEALAKLAPRLPTAALPAALEVAGALEGDYDRSTALVGLAPYLLEEATWQAALSMARVMGFIDPHATALAALAATRPPAERGPLLDEALTVAGPLGSDDLPRVLLQMAACLPPVERREVLDIAVASIEAEAPGQVTEAHAERLKALPEAERLPYARQLVARIRASPIGQPGLLSRVRAALPDAALAEALESVWASSDLATAMHAAPRFLPICQAGGLDLFAALTRALHAFEHLPRGEFLPLLAELAPALAAAGGADAARFAARAILEIGMWWP